MHACHLSLTSGRRRYGFVLVLALLVVLLVAASTFILSRFASSTRHAVSRIEARQRSSLAAESALVEARRQVEHVLAGPSSAWPAAYSHLLPPFLPGGDVSCATTPKATRVAVSPTGIRVDDVAMKVLDRRIEGGRAQGLLSLTVRASFQGRRGRAVTVIREEWIRFVVFRRPRSDVRILLLPGCVGVQVRSA